MSSFMRRLQKMGTRGTTVIVPPDPPDVPRLYLSPASGTFVTNDTVTVQIRVDSKTEVVNTFQANISYPTGLLQFQSLNTTGSPFTTVIQNTESGGLIQLGAGILAGSTSGDQLGGTITFTAIGAGTVNLTIQPESGIARASDSVDVCQSRVGADYLIT